jgi:methanogenic corrinoid protein MtbC1
MRLADRRTAPRTAAKGASRAAAADAPLSIGAVAKATGLSPDTLRVWQKRYGFPVPQRRPSGHRVFTAADVRRLRRIGEALARGHRAGQVVPLAPPKLELLLSDPLRAPAEPDPGPAIAALLAHVRAHRGGELTAALLSDAARLGPSEFLRQRVVPLIAAVGDGWLRGDLGVHHEHFFSERLEDVLRAVRLPFESAASGPRLLLAAFAGETHGLGLQIAALAAACSGLQPHVLGTDTPVSEIAAAYRSRRPAILGISVSVSTAGPRARRQLEVLRGAVPMSVPLLVGGAGARRSRPPGGCIIVEDLAGTLDWMRRLAAARSAGD